MYVYVYEGIERSADKCTPSDKPISEARSVAGATNPAHEEAREKGARRAEVEEKWARFQRRRRSDRCAKDRENPAWSEEKPESAARSSREGDKKGFSTSSLTKVSV